MDTLTPKQRSDRMRLIKGANTNPERSVKRIIRSCGIRPRSHVSALPGRPDIVLSSLRKIILVHGCFWHRHCCKGGKRVPKTRVEYWTEKFHRNRQRDSKVISELRSLGWELLIVWECQIRKPEQLKKRIRQFLETENGHIPQLASKKRCAGPRR